MISTIAAMHFAPTSANLENLVRENIPVEQVFVTGNTGIDALHWASEIDVRFANPELQALHDGDARIVVVTAHRRENWGDGLRGIAEGVARLRRPHPDVHFVAPGPPEPARSRGADRAPQRPDNVLLTEPLGYATFARLLGRAHLVITDSGGIQEEAPSLGKPVLVTRETTERTEGVEAGTLRLVGTDPERIFDEATQLLDDDVAYAEMADAENPYGDGHAAERIVAALEHLLLGGEPPTQFGPGYSRAAVAIAAGMRSERGLGRGSCAARSTARPRSSERRRADRGRLADAGRARAAARGALTCRGADSSIADLARSKGCRWPWAILFTVCLVVVVAMFLWTVLLFVRGHARGPAPAASRRRRAPTASPGSSSSRR